MGDTALLTMKLSTRLQWHPLNDNFTLIGAQCLQLLVCFANEEKAHQRCHHLLTPSLAQFSMECSFVPQGGARLFNSHAEGGNVLPPPPLKKSISCQPNDLFSGRIVREYRLGVQVAQFANTLLITVLASAVFFLRLATQLHLPMKNSHPNAVAIHEEA